MAVEDSGIGDPYWYEWTVGQVRIVEMLNPESHIKSVTLQKSGRKGLDDVVIRYDDGRPDEYIQVKHTRADATLTFGDLTTQDKDGESLLSYLAKTWQAITIGGQQARAVLYTNRQAGSRPYGARPALSEFWPAIQTQLPAAVSLADLQVPPELGEAWKQWSDQLATLPSDRERLDFLKSLDIQTGAPDLESLHEDVVINLARRFGIQRAQAVPLASALDSALRAWATSYRTKDEISLEDVFEALTLPGREQIGDHELPPPAPFFLSRSGFLQTLASTVSARQTPVVFLSGPPGCGKTSLISALANRHDPVVTARFHAYKPITPTTSELPADAGRTTSARALWSDLLTQLRDWFRKTSKLAHYSVPIRNDFLNVEQMRAHVLALAEAWALETNQHTVIAIDGIDHAARSEQPGTWSLLDSLPAPEQVPAHVVFLVAGQLAVANPKYPLWLRTQHPLVTVCDVPGISDDDIAQAVDAQETAIPSEEHPAVVRVVATFARGNTLSAMFAVWECSECSSVAELEARLKERKLSEGLSGYYDSIWNAAVAEVEKIAPLTGRYVAAAISLTAVALTGAMLATLLEDISASALLWSEALARLRPLLVESADGFRLHHNDVRVHLMKLLGQDSAILSNVAYRLAKYYMSKPEFRQQKHGEALNLLRRAHRPREIAELVTPGWILEGWVLRRTMQELVEDTQAGARAALEVKDWDLLHQACCAGLTLSQLRRSEASLEVRPKTSRDRTVPPVLPTEGRVLPQSQWKPQLVRDVIQDAETLVRNGAIARASDLLKRWFRDSPPGEIARHLGRSEAQSDRRQLDDDGRRALERWGAVSQHTGLTWQPVRDEKDVRCWPSAEAAFFRGRIDEALRQRGAAALKRALTCRCFFDSGHIASTIETLFLQAQFPELVVLLEHLPSSIDGPLLLKARVASLVLRRRRLASKFVAADERPFALINLDDYQERLASHADACTLIAIGNAAREPASIRDDALESLYRNYDDKRERPLAALALFASATVARLFGVLSRQGAEAAAAFATPQQLAKLLEDLLAGLREPIKVPSGYHDTVAVILFGVLRIARSVSAEHDHAVKECMKRFTAKCPVSRFVEIVADAFRSRGEIQTLNAWVRSVIGVDGVVWRSGASERLDVARRFESVAQGLDMEAEARAAVERCHWGSIAYADRKEYSLETPLAWFKRLASKDPSRWEREGLRLLAISHEVGRVGDNRTADRVHDAVMTTAIQSGPQAVSALVNASSTRGSIAWLPQPGALLARGYAASVEKLTYAADDLLTIWTLTLGTHAWEDDEDAGNLHNISSALGQAAERIGRGDIKSVMRDVGPAESQGTRAKKSEESVPEKPIPLATIEDAENLFRRQVEPRVSLLAPLSRQIAASPPSSERDTQIERLLRLVSRRDQRYSWTYDGAGGVLRNLVPLLREDIRWSLAESSILRTEGEQADVWLAHMEDIDELCLERAAVLSDAFLERGANRLLQMHEFWITGGDICLRCQSPSCSR